MPVDSRRTSFAAVLTAVVVGAFMLQAASLPQQSEASPPIRSAGACAVIVMSALGVSTPVVQGNAALRPGDRIELRDAGRLGRLSTIEQTGRVGDAFALPVVRDGSSLRIPVNITQGAPLRAWLAGLAVKLLILLTGLLVLWRGRDRASLCFGTASLCIAVAMYPAPAVPLPAAGRLLFAIGSVVLAEAAALSLYLMVETLARGILTSGTLFAARVVVMAALGITVLDDVISQPSRFLTGCVVPQLREAHLPAYMLALLVTLLILAFAYARAAGQQRQRLRWIVWSTAIGFSGVITSIASTLASHPIPLYPLAELTAVAIPLGYAYAILRHRVLDVSFVLNRALVIGTLSTIILAIFALVGKLVERAAVSENAGLAIQLAAACAIALSFDALRLRVRMVVDELFFRERRKAQMALGRFIDEAPYIRGTETLCARAVDEIHRHLGTETAALYVDEDTVSGYRLRALNGVRSLPEALDVDDPLFVRLRATRRELHAEEVESGLGARGMAFPLAAGGTLLGALVCVPQANEQTWDPDQTRLARAVAQSVAVAYAAIQGRIRTEAVKAVSAELSRRREPT
ncbi:MAG: GAF domain-containing protein [bacterium]|nr:GAF domain-containing protein [bacterium]